jgi:hypothetical protein
MIINEVVGECEVTVGKPSKNHVQLKHVHIQDEGYSITLGYGQWQDLKRIVDKMFVMLDDVCKPM